MKKSAKIVVFVGKNDPVLKLLYPVAKRIEDFFLEVKIRVFDLFFFADVVLAKDKLLSRNKNRFNIFLHVGHIFLEIQSKHAKTPKRA